MVVKEEKLKARQRPLHPGKAHLFPQADRRAIFSSFHFLCPHTSLSITFTMLSTSIPSLPAYVLPNPTSLLRLVQCYKCFMHGHLSSECPSPNTQEICSRCAQPNHSHLSCPNPPQCAHCGGPHPVTSTNCPIYIEKHYTHLIITLQFMLDNPQYTNDLKNITPHSPFKLPTQNKPHTRPQPPPQPNFASTQTTQTTEAAIDVPRPKNPRRPKK